MLKRIQFKNFFILLAIFLLSFGVHKFYVSIYQVRYNQDKKRVEITTRVFIDDLTKAIQLKQESKSYLGTTKETPEDIIALKKYFSSNFLIKINNVTKKIEFKRKELEGNVLICYFVVTNMPKIQTVEIQNTALFDLFPEQQNIIQIDVNNHKQNLLLTANNVKGMLKD